MPGVTILPNSPGLGGFGSSPHTSKWMPVIPENGGTYTTATSATQNGFPKSFDSMSVSEIKKKAQESVQREARGASGLALIKTARTQLVTGKDYESQGDYKNALEAFTKAASLAKMTMDSAELKSESRPGKKGVLFKEFNDFFTHEGKDLAERTSIVEERLKAIEKLTATSDRTEEPDEGPIRKPGGSIADRVRSLQDAGMTGSTTKRISREVANLPTPPTSPSHRVFPAALTSPPSLSSLVPVTPTSSAPSPHVFVSPSTLGPPSPSSSPSSSPQQTQLSLSEFAHAFPAIDELDELDELKLPSVPTGGSNGSSRLLSRDRGANELPAPVAFRGFAVPIDRPSSTPLTPTRHAFASRPASPNRSPLLPNSPTKPTDAFTHPPPPAMPSPEKPSLPATNTIFPQALYDYMLPGSTLKVLLLDVRTRAEFEDEHINADAVVCLEPSVLLRDNVSSSTLEDALIVGPRHEWGLFFNREKFDLIVVYDKASTTFNPAGSPLSALVRAIYETEFRKILRHTPMLLVGGLEAWRRDMGDQYVTRGAAETSSSSASQKPSAATVQSLGLSYGPPPPLPSLSDSHQQWPLHSPIDASAAPVSAELSSPPVSASYSSDSSKPWLRPRADTNSVSAGQGVLPPSEHRPHYSLDQKPLHSRSPAEISNLNGQTSDSLKSLTRRPAISRPAISSTPAFSRTISDHIIGSAAQSMVNGSAITYPQFPKATPPPSGSPFASPPPHYNIASPPQASINPTLSRRRSDYVDQSQEAISALSARPPIDYPELSAQQVIRPPPAVASSALERQDNRPRVHHNSFSTSQAGPKPPRIPSDYPVTYWPDTQISTSGLKNLGNTCYMNATIQCLSATVPFARFFTDGRWKSAVNYTNPLGSKGNIANAFAKILHEMWHGDLPYITPIEFRKSICQQKAQYNGTDQHDSQEFLSFLLDGIHEDLNRIIVKPMSAPTPEEEAELEKLPPQIASEKEWRNWRMRNDSLIVDWFQGQFRNRLECMTCHQTSTTYNVFSLLQVPVPHGRSGKVSLQRCIDAFFNEEIMEKDDAWDCPRCKAKRKATKQLSLARLPPILIIHLKRFETHGRFSDKVDTFVDYPVKSLDLTNYMPPPLPPGVDKGLTASLAPEDPRTQMPPYKYELYGVTNHYGNLSSGHYTAFIASRGGWLYCDDSSIKPADPKQVVNQKAYVLFYKRTEV